MSRLATPAAAATLISGKQGDGGEAGVHQFCLISGRNFILAFVDDNITKYQVACRR